jgi:Tfp pilus assembly protein PilF
MKMPAVILCAYALFTLGAAAAAAPDKLPAPPRLPEQPDIRENTPPPSDGPARPDEAYGSVTGSRFYRQCLELVNENADRAYDEATLWRDQGGGAAAEHCAAMALAGLGQLEEAARRLTRIAGEQAEVEPELRAEIFSQAGLLWLMKGKAEPAHEAFSQALLTSPAGDPARAQYFLDRAQAAANLGRWRNTETDATQTLALQARADAFILRARAHRALGDLVSARNDVNAALNLEPENAEALLERGQVRQDSGDIKGARADWLRVKTQTGSPELQGAARHRLAELDARLLKDCTPGEIELKSAEGVHLDLSGCPQ